MVVEDIANRTMINFAITSVVMKQVFSMYFYVQYTKEGWFSN